MCWLTDHTVNLKRFPEYIKVEKTSTTGYRAFHRFGQAKIDDGGLVLGSSQFSLPPNDARFKKWSKST